MEAAAFVHALGGAANLRSVDACTTRLRLEVVDSARVDAVALAALGAMGVVRPSSTAVQVVLGPVADQVAARIRRELQLPVALAASPAPASPAPGLHAPPLPAPALPLPGLAVLPPEAAELWLEVLGGAANLVAVDCAAGRLLVTVRDSAAVEELRLVALAPRGRVRTRTGEWQVLLGDQAATVAATLQAHLGQ